MSLTRKNYERIAEILKEKLRRCPGRGSDAGLTVEAIAGELAEYFAEDNPHFDRCRFLKACEIEEEDQTKPRKDGQAACGSNLGNGPWCWCKDCPYDCPHNQS